MRKFWWGTGAAVLAAGILGWVLFRSPSLENRVYTIGWSEAPPFQVRGSGGQPTGLAVDLVRTAALRRGIKLKWVHWDNTSESALRLKKLDLWPLITITKERLRYFHISQPYLEAE